MKFINEDRKTLIYDPERARIETPCDFKSMHSRAVFLNILFCSRHPFRVKNFGGTLTSVSFYLRHP